jgi:hypothetical protein
VEVEVEMEMDKWKSDSLKGIIHKKSPDGTELEDYKFF